MPKLSATASLLAIAAFATAPTPIWAQDTGEGAAAEGEEEIVVTAERIRGQVDTDVPPVFELDAEEIASYGAGSIEELIEQLAPQTGSGRGRGEGRPVFLINGQRSGGFREFRRYPPEAIRKVEVLPEEVALQFGYPADQRVINIILQDNFASREVEVEYGMPDRGGTGNGEIEVSQLTINGNRRLNIGMEYNTTSLLTEDERDIVQTPGSTPTVAGDPDPAPFRSLRGSSDSWELDATLNSTLGDAPGSGTFSVNGGVEHTTGRSLSGLDVVTLTANGESAVRTLDDDPLTRRNSSTKFSLGGSVIKPLGLWTLDTTLDASRTESTSLIDRRRDASVLQDLVDAGELEIDGVLPVVPGAGVDRSESKTYTIDTLATLRGNPILLPSGEVSVTFDAGYKLNGIDSVDTRSSVGRTSLDRRRASVGANLGIPIASAREGFLGALGELSLNLAAGVDHLSDFGTLADYTTGLSWKPAERLSLQASYIWREAAPSLSQLGDPIVTEYNVPVYDFAAGESVLATIVSGGNSSLSAETQRDIKVSANYEIDLFDRANIVVEYFRNRSDDVTQNFPLLTPAIEAAFPDRVVRDPAGNLVSIDRRPITFEGTKSSRLRYGINLFGRVGKEEPEGGGGERRERMSSGRPSQGDGQGARGPGGLDPAQMAELRQKFCATPEGETPDLSGLPERMLARLKGEDGQIDPAKVAALRERMCSADGAARAQRGGGGEGGRRGGGGGMRFGRGGGGDGQGRWYMALYHSIEFENEVLVAPGGPVLDQLSGQAFGNGVPRHKIELQGGLFYKGLGLRLSGDYQSATRIDGSGLAGSQDLFFDDIAKFNLRAFVNLEQQDWLTGGTPGFWKGSRLSFSVDNLFDAQQRVTDSSGVVPLSYQPALVDPLGRTFEIEFRKLF